LWFADGRQLGVLSEVRQSQRHWHFPSSCFHQPERSLWFASHGRERGGNAGLFHHHSSDSLLLIEPFNRNRFVRFHAFQCLFTCGALIVLQIVLSIFSHILPIFMFGIWSLLGLAELVLWILLVVKAYQHEMFKLPVVGDMAEKQAGA
jgi:uncharacterized membrane protein